MIKDKRDSRRKQGQFRVFQGFVFFGPPDIRACCCSLHVSIQHAVPRFPVDHPHHPLPIENNNLLIDPLYALPPSSRSGLMTTIPFAHDLVLQLDPSIFWLSDLVHEPSQRKMDKDGLFGSLFFILRLVVELSSAEVGYRCRPSMMSSTQGSISPPEDALGWVFYRVQGGR